MTPLHELSRSVPDFVKFGPILPKSAGFSLTPRAKDDENETIRLEFMHIQILNSLNLCSCACLCFVCVLQISTKKIVILFIHRLSLIISILFGC